MGRKCKIPKKLVEPATSMVEESLVEGKSLNEHAYFVRHRLSQKGKLLWHHINSLYCYALNLCEIYDFTCCSEDPKKHLPYQCKFIDNGSYLLMPKVFIITMILNKLKNLFLLRVPVKLVV